MKLTASLVIPSYNARSQLATHLPAVMAAAGHFNHQTGSRVEVIVVDDASSDNTADWIKDTYPMISVIRNDRNERFGISCNRGVAAAKGDVIVLLNNDVEPEKDFLVPLIRNFSDPVVFAVGCRERNWENGKEVIGGAGVSAFRRGLMLHWRPLPGVNTPRITWVSGGSAAFRRKAWIELGGFDRLFRPAYEEDRDLCWQALKAGYKVIFEEKAVVTHRHETTNVAVFGKERIALYSLKNQLLFIWKNLSSPRLLLLHMVWLPYHLVLSTYRTRGIFFLAFLAALWQFPEAMKARFQAGQHWRKSDEAILGRD